MTTDSTTTEAPSIDASTTHLHWGEAEATGLLAAPQQFPQRPALTLYSAAQAVTLVQQWLRELPATIAGSAILAKTREALDFTPEFSDVDVFCPNMLVVSTALERLANTGYFHLIKDEQRWARYQSFGLTGRLAKATLAFILEARDPETGRILVEHPCDPTQPLTVNIVYKTLSDKPLTTPLQVLESFDLELLATAALDVATGQMIYASKALNFSDDLDQLVPRRRHIVESGLLTEYQAYRMLERYLKYIRRGYNLDGVKQSLIQGYRAAAAWRTDQDSVDEYHSTLAELYTRFANYLEYDNLEELDTLVTAFQGSYRLNQQLLALIDN